MKFQGVNFDDLKLVRVVKSLENSGISGNQLIIKKLADEQSASLRNTLHFTLNSVVQDHAYGTFSESRYAVIADLKETSKQNKLVGLNEVDTFFWQKESGTALNNPTIFIPDTDKASLDKFSAFNTITYKSDEDPKQNFQNLTQAVKENFQANNLPFHSPSNWGWAGKPQPDKYEFNALERHLGASNLVDRHDGSVYAEMEALKSRVHVLTEDLGAATDQNSFESLQSGHESDVINTAFSDQLNRISHDAEIKAYFNEHLGSAIKNLNDLRQDKINTLYPETVESTINAVQPPPLPKHSTTPSVNVSVDEAIRLLKSQAAPMAVMPPPIPNNNTPKIGSILDKFSQQANPNNLQFKTALTGIYCDLEFDRIKRLKSDSDHALHAAGTQLAGVLGMNIDGVDSPFEILQRITHHPDAKEALKQKFNEDPELKARLAHDLNYGLQSANLYQSNLTLYTQDVVDTVEHYATQDITDNHTKAEYREVLGNLNEVFKSVDQENTLGVQQLNLYFKDIQELTGEIQFQELRTVKNENSEQTFSKAQELTASLMTKFETPTPLQNSPSVEKQFKIN